MIGASYDFCKPNTCWRISLLYSVQHEIWVKPVRLQINELRSGHWNQRKFAEIEQCPKIASESDLLQTSLNYLEVYICFVSRCTKFYSCWLFGPFFRMYLDGGVISMLVHFISGFDIERGNVGSGLCFCLAAISNRHKICSVTCWPDLCWPNDLLVSEIFGTLAEEYRVFFSELFQLLCLLTCMSIFWCP